MVERALQHLRRAPAHTKDRRTAVMAEATLLEARMRHLVDQIARDYATDTLLGEQQAAEQRKRALGASGTARPGSDVDVAILFDPPAPPLRSSG